MSMISYPPPPGPKNKKPGAGSRAKDVRDEPPENSQEPVDDPEGQSENNELRAALRALTQHQALLELGLDGFVRFVNDQFTMLSGYEANELLNRHFSVLFDPSAFAKPEYRELWTDLAAGKPRTEVLKQFAKFGREQTVRVSFHPVADENGSVYKVLTTFVDVSEESHGQGDARAQLDAMNRTAAVGEFDLSGSLLAVNENFSQLLGYGADEVGRRIELFADGQPQGLFDDLARGEIRKGQFKLRARGGREVWVHAAFSPVLDGRGKPTKVLFTAGDVTASVESDQSNQRNAALLENLPMALMFTDRGGSIRYTNSACVRLFRRIEGYLGVRADQLVGTSIDGLMHGAGQHWPGDVGGGPRRLAFKLGSEVFEAQISGSHDPQSGQSGAMVVWEQITERQNAAQTASRYAQSLASASEELSAVAKQMTSNSEQTTAQSNLVAQASEQVTSNVTSVAASAEQMSSTVREIAKNAHDAARVATAAVRAAEETNKTVAQLGDSSMEIGKVIKVITSIAQQTNLLALNATIEAARAGEAGKGFAVVANEVKELAKQTAKATEDISQKIEAIQNDTKGAVAAIHHIGKIIGQINDFQNTIASAVEQQAATTNEIARNASEAARGSLQISGNIGAVSVAARNTSEGAANTLASAEELSRVASELRSLIDGGL
ncbi:MAG: PAS domain-containing methyl-accepting chemotaxis protein [Polyangiales bacterium]